MYTMTKQFYFTSFPQSLPLLVMHQMEISLLLTPTLLEPLVVLQQNRVPGTHWDPKMLCV